MKKILLDTNAYTLYLKGDDAVLSALGSADIICMSVIVLGELYAGFEGGKKEQENRKNLHRFLEKPGVIILEVTAETAEIFGSIKNRQKKKGEPLPINDIWIAAQVMETGSILITYDGHFRTIESIRTWDFS